MDPAERAEPVALTLAYNRRVPGHIDALGNDLPAIRLQNGRLSLIGRTTVTAVHLQAGASDLAGDRLAVGPAHGTSNGSRPRLDLNPTLKRLLVDHPVVRV